MTSLPYSTIDLASEEVTTILSIFNSLQSRHEVDFTKDFNFPFEDFALFETYLNYSIGPVIEVKQNGNVYFVTFTQVCYRFNSPSRFAVPPIKEYQTWCVLPLNREYQHVLVKTETLLDKIHELIHPIEVDFKEDPDFSKDFYVVTSDEWIARKLLDAKFPNYLKQLKRKDVWIEISKDKLIIGNQKYIDNQATLEMADLIAKIAELQK